MKKKVDIEINLGVSGDSSGKGMPSKGDTDAARRKAAEALRNKQLREAEAAAKERTRTQAAAAALAKKDSQAFKRAQREVDRKQKAKARERERAAKEAQREAERRKKAEAADRARQERERALAAKRAAVQARQREQEQIRAAKAAEKERLREQSRKAAQARADSKSFAAAQKVLDKRNKGREISPISGLTRSDDVRSSLMRKFMPLSQYPRIDKGHAATSDDRVARGVKEAEEIESRLRRKGSRAGLGGLLTGVATLPAYAAMGIATGHPGALAGGVMWAGKKIVDKGDEYAQMNRAKMSVDPKSVGMLGKAMPGAIKVLGASVAALGALQLSSINKRLEITQERAALELPLAQAAHVSGKITSYRVPESRRAPGDTRTRQKAVVTELGGGQRRVVRAYPPVDTKAPIDESKSKTKDRMPDLNWYRTMAERYGMAPQESAQILRDFAVGSGVSNSVTAITMDLLGQARMQGIGLGGLTEVARLAGAGGGATYGAGAPGERGDLGLVISKIIGSAESVGLRGSRIDEYLKRTASATSQLAEKGFMMSVEGANELALAINKQGFNEASGMGALRTAQRLQTLGPRTAQELGSQMFSPLARGVMLAKGMEGAGSLTEFFENLSGLSKSRTGGLETIDAFRRFLGEGEGAMMGLIGAGESSATAQAALRTKSLVGAPDMTVLRQSDIASSMGVSRALANRQVSRLEEVTLDMSQTLIGITEKLDQIILAFTSNDSLMGNMLQRFDDFLPWLQAQLDKNFK